MSHFRVLRTAQTNPFYAAAVRDLPGYTTAVAVAEQAEAMLAELPAPGADIPSPLVTGSLTEEWLAATVAAESVTNERAARHRALTAIRDAAHGHISSAVVIHVDAALSALNSSLAEVLSQGRAICDRLGGATDPAAAIAAGPDATAAWTELAPVAERYRQVRAAQMAVLAEFTNEVQASRSNNNPDDRATDLHLSNLDELSPGWRQQHLDYSGRLSWAAPWPADDIEYLIWLCTSAADPWVPTLAELAALRAGRAPELTDTRPSPFPRTSNGIQVINAVLR